MVVVILAERTEYITLTNPNDYIREISTEIDAVLENLQVLNDVFARANRDYSHIFWKLRNASSGVFTQAESMDISLKGEGKNMIFFHQKRHPRFYIIFNVQTLLHNFSRILQRICETIVENVGQWHGCNK